VIKKKNLVGFPALLAVKRGGALFHARTGSTTNQKTHNGKRSKRSPSAGQKSAKQVKKPKRGRGKPHCVADHEGKNQKKNPNWAGSCLLDGRKRGGNVLSFN